MARKEWRTVSTVQKPAGKERSYQMRLEAGDELRLEYESSSAVPSRMVILHEDGTVVTEADLRSGDVLEHTIDEAGTYTVHVTWAASGKVELYTTAAEGTSVVYVDGDGYTWESQI